TTRAERRANRGRACFGDPAQEETPGGVGSRQGRRRVFDRLVIDECVGRRPSLVSSYTTPVTNRNPRGDGGTDARDAEAFARGTSWRSSCISPPTTSG